MKAKKERKAMAIGSMEDVADDKAQAKSPECDAGIQEACADTVSKNDVPTSPAPRRRRPEAAREL